MKRCFGGLLLAVVLTACDSSGSREEAAAAVPPVPPARSAQVHLVLEGRESHGKKPSLPHVVVNMEQGYVDVEGTICLDAGLLELVATVQAAKEHEAILTVKARPRHIHMGLLMLGLDAGLPGRWVESEEKPGEWTPVHATGGGVLLSLIYEKEGEMVERPVSDFIRNRVDGTALPSNLFVFAGSQLVEPEKDDPYYAADQSGDVATLVTFADEMLALPVAASSANAGLTWEINESEVPPLGTPVVLRIRAAQPAPPESR